MTLIIEAPLVSSRYATLLKYIFDLELYLNVHGDTSKSQIINRYNGSLSRLNEKLTPCKSPLGKRDTLIST